ncbi:MAG: hypothetical protein WDM91_11245 [Rhizomicrobium sp.]
MMKPVIFAAALLVAPSAFAQNASPPGMPPAKVPAAGDTAVPPADRPPVPAGGFDADTPIEALVADPAAKAVLMKDVPHLLEHPDYESFKMMSLNELQPISKGTITDEILDRINKDLKALGTSPKQ